MTPDSPDQGRPDIAVLVCTYNRQTDLAELLESALAQEAGDFTYEVVVVDNNSTDATTEVARAFAQRAPERIRPHFDPRSGKGNALETGLAAIRAPLFVIIDDDEIMPPGYLAELVRVFRNHPDIDIVGSRVSPLWAASRPSWLTPRQYNALGLTDYGDAPIRADAGRPLTLLNAAFRTAAVRAVGGYDRALGVAPGVSGGTEDAELMDRLYAAGHAGLYWPAAEVFHKVAVSRIGKAYFRKWHHGHGVYYARSRLAWFEQSGRHVLTIPGHVLRAALQDVGRYAVALLQGRPDAAFHVELRLRFAQGFITTRLGTFARERRAR